MLRFDRKQQNSVKQLSFNLKKKKTRAKDKIQLSNSKFLNKSEKSQDKL